MGQLSNKWAVPEKDIGVLLEYAKNVKGIDLSAYRHSFLSRRLKIRIDAVNVKDFAEYTEILEKNPGEWPKFLDNLNINVSEFFRDNEVFEYFGKVCIPKLIENKKRLNSQGINCWSCGCSCGEEPYSLAILFREALKNDFKKYSLRITATDVDEDALAKARIGEYEFSAIARLDPAVVKRYFEALPEKRYRVIDEIKKDVYFKSASVIHGAVPAGMDVVFFRNLKIYFGQKEGQTVLNRIIGSLNKDGYLVLGRVENVGDLSSKFEMLSARNKIFRKI